MQLQDETLDLIRRVGHALYGDQWQEPLARDLDISGRAVRYWFKRPSGAPEGILIKLLVILKQRAQTVSNVIADVEARVGVQE